MELTSNRPYLVRAFYEWLLDNSQTPYLLVDVAGSNVEVPQQFVEDGHITLNIAPSAVHNLELGNEFISFNARFGGRPMDVLFPVASVLGIYAQESGGGMLFPDDESPGDGDLEPEAGPPRGRPSLKVVRSGKKT